MLLITKHHAVFPCRCSVCSGDTLYFPDNSRVYFPDWKGSFKTYDWCIDSDACTMVHIFNALTRISAIHFFVFEYRYTDNNQEKLWWVIWLVYVVLPNRVQIHRRYHFPRWWKEQYYIYFFTFIFKYIQILRFKCTCTRYKIKSSLCNKV